MTTPLFDEDPARDADQIAAAWAAQHQRRDPVDECLEHVHAQLVAAAAWDIGKHRDEHTDDAADLVTQQLRAHLIKLNPAVLVEALMLSLWESAQETAIAAHKQTRREVDLLEAHINPLPRRTPGEPGATVVGTTALPATCQDPDGHTIEHVDVVGWRKHLKLTGRCARCGRLVIRKRGKTT